MKEPIRVLHVLGSLNIGGAESRIMDIYRHIDKSRVQFDFVVHTQKKGFFEEEIESLGGAVYRIPRFQLYNYFQYKKCWRKLLEKHKEWKIIHGHMTSTAAIYLPIAKSFEQVVTIAHARSAGVDQGIKGKLTKWMRKSLSKKTDYCFACSSEAGKAVFGASAMKLGKVKILPNTIDAKKFSFSEGKRKLIRERLGIETGTVIGHVGRFHPCKNHEFLIRVFYEYLKSNKNSYLLLIGEGSEMEAVQKKTIELGISSRVIFAGNRSDVENYYSAMDYFVFPSFYEGMPGTVIEAQAAGLPCLVSNRITSEVKVTDLVTFLDIDENPEDWTAYLNGEGLNTNRDRYKEIVDVGFDVCKQAKQYEEFYCTGRWVV